MFKVEFTTDGAAVGEDPYAVAALLQAVAEEVRGGRRRMVLRDGNGNRVGGFKWTREGDEDHA